MGKLGYLFQPHRYHEHMKSVLEVLHDSALIAQTYGVVRKVLQYELPGTHFLVKQKDWIAVCAHEELIDEMCLLEALHHNSLNSCTAVSWYMIEPEVMQVPSTEKGLGQFFMRNIGWFVLFSGKPDWLILFVNQFDFWIVIGESDFVNQALGCSPEFAFADLQERVVKSRFFSEIGKKHFEYLIHQLQEVYPDAQPGDRIDFEFT